MLDQSSKSKLVGALCLAFVACMVTSGREANSTSRLTPVKTAEFHIPGLFVGEAASGRQASAEESPGFDFFVADGRKSSVSGSPRMPVTSIASVDPDPEVVPGNGESTTVVTGMV